MADLGSGPAARSDLCCLGKVRAVVVITVLVKLSCRATSGTLQHVKEGKGTRPDMLRHEWPKLGVLTS